MSQNKEFPELLIEEVKKFEHIYNSKLKDHKNRNVIKNSWASIAANTNSTAEVCKSTWKNLRDSFNAYNKSIISKSGDAANKRRKWIYFDLMSFLKDFTCTRATTSNLTVTELSQEDNVLDRSMYDDIGESNNTIQTEHENNSASIPTSIDKQFSAPCTVRKSLKQQQTKSEIQQLMDIISKENDEIDTFGQLVAQKIRNMNGENRERCMLEIHQLLFKYRPNCINAAENTNIESTVYANTEPTFTDLVRDAATCQFTEIHYQ